MSRGIIVVLVAAIAIAMLGLNAPNARAGGPTGASIVRLGSDVTVEGPTGRIVVVDGNVHLTRTAQVNGDVVVVLGHLQRDPGASVTGSEYVLSPHFFVWIPGPAWVVVVLALMLFLAYRAAVWWAVSAISHTLVRTTTFERWSAGWEPRPAVAVLIGIVGVVLAVPALGLLALSVVLVPLALAGLALLLIAAGVGLAFYRESPSWPSRLPPLAYAAYIALPPALEIGLVLTAAGGVGAGVRAISRAAKRQATRQT